MVNRFLGVTYYQGIGALLGLLFAFLATWATTTLIHPSLRQFNIRAYGLEPPVEVAKITAADVSRPWRDISEQGGLPNLPPPTLEDLYLPQFPNAPLPRNSAKANELELNLFYALMYYGQPLEAQQGHRLTYEYDADSGAGRVVFEVAEEEHTDFMSYHLALELLLQLHPEIAIFDSARTKMRSLAPRLIETAPTPDVIASTPRAPSLHPYWLARQLADLTGIEAYDALAEQYGQGMIRMGVGYANMLAEGRPLTLFSSHFSLPSVMYDMADRTSNPELRRKAAELMTACIDFLYDAKTRTIYNDYGTLSGPGSDTREAIDTFEAIEGLWKYYQLTGDTNSHRLVTNLSEAFTFNTAELSPFLDLNMDVYRLYAMQGEQGTLTMGDRVRTDLNLRALMAVQALNQDTGFDTYDQDFAILLSTFRKKFYDDIHNGFYLEYQFTDPDSQRYTPVKVTNHSLLSVRIPARLTALILQDRWARAQALAGGAAGSPAIAGDE